MRRRFGDSETPIWITEVGGASGGAPSGLTLGVERHAGLLHRTFELAAEGREWLGIAGVVWCSLNVPRRLWVGHCGLFTLVGEAKQSRNASLELTGGAA